MKLKKIKICSLLLSVCMLSTSLVACSEPVNIVQNTVDDTTQDYPVVFGDLTVSAKPSKVAVFSDSIADIIVALDYQDSVVLVDNENDISEFADKEKASIEDVSLMSELGVELVITEPLEANQLRELKSKDIAVAEIEPANDRDGFELKYKEIASLLNGAATGSKKAATVSKKILQTLDELKSILPDKSVQITAMMITDMNNGAVTGDSFQDDVMEFAGLKNVFSGNTNGIVDFSSRDYLMPEYIFCAPGLKDLIIADENLAITTAVINGDVYELPEEYFYLSGKTVVDCAIDIVKLVYPELDESLDKSPEFPEELLDESSSSELEEVNSAVSELESSLNKEYTELFFEDESTDIFDMQERLFLLGYLKTDTYTGFFGDSTVEALKLFQEEVGLEPTGLADVKTLEKLYNIDDSEGESSAESGIESNDESSNESSEESSSETSETSESSEVSE